MTSLDLASSHISCWGFCNMIRHQPGFCGFFLEGGGGGAGGSRGIGIDSVDFSRFFSNSFLSFSSCTLFAKNVLKWQENRALQQKIYQHCCHSGHVVEMTLTCLSCSALHFSYLRTKQLQVPKPETNDTVTRLCSRISFLA